MCGEMKCHAIYPWGKVMAADPASLVAGGIATGAFAVMLSMGVQPAVLVWVVLGSMVGMAATGPLSWWRGMIVFVGSVFASALCAQIAARAWFGSDELWRNGMAMALGMFFPLIKARIETALPGIIDRLLHRIGLGPKPAGDGE